VEVIGVRRRGGRIGAVEMSAGELRPGSVVVAAGAWTPRSRFTRDLDFFIPVQGEKGYHVADAGRSPDPRFMQESRVIATPLAGRLRLAGTFELAGLDLSIEARRTDAIVAAARRVLPRLGAARVLELWCGLRPCAPDGLPLIGRPAELENLLLATGHAMLGSPPRPSPAAWSPTCSRGRRPATTSRRSCPTASGPASPPLR
jgi:D-amino-acid dehydrogenase